MKNNKLYILAMVALLSPLFAFGALVSSGDSVSLDTEGGINDNVYTAGGNVTVAVPVTGDVIAVGGNIQVLKDVSQDLAIAGGSVTVLGNTGGDVRVAGGNILIDGDVAGDLIVMGGTITVSPNASVGKDVIIMGGQITLGGDVLGDVEIGGGVVSLNGHVQGNVKATIDGTLTIGEKAVIDGGLEYKAKNVDALAVTTGAVITGETVFKEARIDTMALDRGTVRNMVLAIIGVLALFKLVSLLIAALLVTWLFKKYSHVITEEALRKPLKMLGRGFVALVIIPVAGVLLLITLFGAMFGIIAILSYVSLLILSCIYAGVVVGVWLSRIVYKTNETTITWKNVTVGVVLLTLVSFIPVIGWVVRLFVVLITLGSITNIVYRKLQEGR
ncbi:MAG: hypothetical protein A3B07_03435 [Candidatus Yonathbacteria bacterium RIFCSPLOWO2_01_FULL_43_27]|uniref:DUF8173 domain-containing protein n=2 Tax=Parcubacteria group TaxID=1794811 RepID=A0A1G2SD40_9BACT|nr:MAG: hypothetical protein A2658_00385 [Candidatus Yonathbacteria bacterium RIFCSPHIGHO2_01_FULL_44_19]OHA82914.1 MAG: hypothetical protein A3B07_03435 [Candidatus Yonathbacteria bacterium RIFCSPLOWO2_01_FULL_43_27]